MEDGIVVIIIFHLPLSRMHDERPDGHWLHVPPVAGDDRDVVVVHHHGDGAQGEAGGHDAETVAVTGFNVEDLKLREIEQLMPYV